VELLEKDEEYIISLLKEGKKLDAIAFVKDKTGMTLKEAKDYIDKKVNNEYYEKNISISKEDEEYICSLINENKKLQAVAFLHKEKEMTLKEAKDYIDREVLKNKITAKKPIHKRGYIFDEKLDILIPNLTRQKKALKIMLSIFLVLLVITLIQLIFLDRSSDIKMIILRYSISGILLLIITLPLIILNIHIIKNKLKKLENLELSNQFEVKAFISSFDLFANLLLLLIFIIMIPIALVKTYKKGEYKDILYIILLIVFTIYGVYELLKMLKYKKYSLNISNKKITLLYNKNEIKSIKIENINFINFYTKEFKKGRKYNIPIIQILDRKKNIFAEMDIKISDCILLKKYFKKYEVLVDDEFNKI